MCFSQYCTVLDCSYNLAIKMGKLLIINADKMIDISHTLSYTQSNVFLRQQECGEYITFPPVSTAATARDKSHYQLRCLSENPSNDSKVLGFLHLITNC